MWDFVKRRFFDARSRLELPGILEMLYSSWAWLNKLGAEGCFKFGKQTKL
jgi:hypothetical protein